MFTIAVLIFQMHSWWWRGGMVLVMIFLAASLLYRDRRRFRS